MRRLLVLVSTIVFVDAMLFGALAPLVPGYAREFGLSKTGAGLLVGAFGAGALLGGIPGGLAAARWGPRRAVVVGLALLAVASFAFAAAEGPWALGFARLIQGASSTVTWAGALAWLTVATPRERRGELIGTAFGAAVFGAILGPMFGAVADAVGVRVAFGAVGIVAAGLAAWAATRPAAAREAQAPNAVRRALTDRSFLGGLWLNTLPAWLFGMLVVLVPLRLDAGGFAPFAIGGVFLAAGLVEVAVNPLLGRFSDRRGRLLPVRTALAASIVVAVAFAFARDPYPVAALTVLAAISFGAFYTPGMALVSDRSELAGLSQAIGFGIMNTAWALGNMSGPSLAGLLAEAGGDTLPYLLAAGLCAVTLAATRIARAPSARRAAPGGSSSH
ncbi:MAG TPA: MFS transporter [Gaiellaceae bacterium]|nr:MFS transporter [Gaiellaceae bacterium]